MDVALVGQRIERVRDLAGFRSSHRVPLEANEYGEAFVGRIAADQIDADLDVVYTRLRTEFRLRRAELSVSPPAEGCGSVSTPFFDYSVVVTLNPDDPSRVTWRRQVAEIREPDQVLSEPFAAVFGSTFQAVELTPAGPVDLGAFIDRLEALQSERITLEYDKSATWCRVRLDGIAGDLEVTARSWLLQQSNSPSPVALVQAFLEFQAALIDPDDAGSLAFGASARARLI